MHSYNFSTSACLFLAFHLILCRISKLHILSSLIDERPIVLAGECRAFILGWLLLVLVFFLIWLWFSLFFLFVCLGFLLFVLGFFLQAKQKGFALLLALLLEIIQDHVIKFTWLRDYSCVIIWCLQKSMPKSEVVTSPPCSNCVYQMNCNFSIIIIVLYVRIQNVLDKDFLKNPKIQSIKSNIFGFCLVPFYLTT